tara:strand:- start:946 stop:1269 length:324 start_codon:yes stop_codon:yes gene_type:complete
MSFDILETKLQDRSKLLKSLEEIDERPNTPWKGTSVIELVLLSNRNYEDLETIEVDFSIGVDVGFRLNKETNNYDFIFHEENWSKDLSIEEFLDKLSNQYNKIKNDN